VTRFAEGTTVSSEKSRAEIEQTVRRYGADMFISGWEGDIARITFRVKERFIRFDLKLPRRDEKRFTHWPKPSDWKTRADAAAEKLWRAEERRVWRALLLLIKAKLEAVESGMAAFEAEFLGNVVLPDNQTVADFMRPYVELAYSTGKAPQLAATSTTSEQS
jgi:hypothetical protein